MSSPTSSLTKPQTPCATLHSPLPQLFWWKAQVFIWKCLSFIFYFHIATIKPDLTVETTDKVALFVPPTTQETQCPLFDQTLNFGEKIKIFLILGWTFCFKILSTQPWVICYNLHFNLRSSGFCRDTPLRRASLWMSILIFNIVKYSFFNSPQFNI